MVDVDRWEFRLDTAFVPIGSVFLYDVLRAANFTQPIGLEAGVYGLAVITCGLATAALLLLVRPRLTDWEAPEAELRILRVALPLAWVSSLQLLNLPNRGLWGSIPRHFCTQLSASSRLHSFFLSVIFVHYSGR